MRSAMHGLHESFEALVHSKCHHNPVAHACVWLVQEGEALRRWLIALTAHCGILDR